MFDNLGFAVSELAILVFANLLCNDPSLRRPRFKVGERLDFAAADEGPHRVFGDGLIQRVDLFAKTVELFFLVVDLSIETPNERAQVGYLLGVRSNQVVERIDDLKYLPMSIDKDLKLISVGSHPVDASGKNRAVMEFGDIELGEWGERAWVEVKQRCWAYPTSIWKWVSTGGVANEFGVYCVLVGIGLSAGRRGCTRDEAYGEKRREEGARRRKFWHRCPFGSFWSDSTKGARMHLF